MATNFSVQEAITNDGVSKSVVGNDAEDVIQPFIANKNVSFQLGQNNVKPKAKPPSVSSTHDNSNCRSSNDKHKLSFKKYAFGDEDSLNSSSNQGEDIML